MSRIRAAIDDRHRGGVPGGRGCALRGPRRKSRACGACADGRGVCGAQAARRRAARAAHEADAARGRALRVPAEAAAQHGRPGDRRGAGLQRQRVATPARARQAPCQLRKTTAATTRSAHKLATITGRVEVKGKPWGPIYVYVDNVKEPLVDRNVEIVQKDRSFVPNVLVVQKGTRVAFPNADPFLHNVFSPSHDASVRPRQLPARRQGRRGQAVQRRASSRCSVTCTRRCARTSWSFPTATTSRRAPTGASAWKTSRSARDSWSRGRPTPGRSPNR